MVDSNQCVPGTVDRNTPAQFLYKATKPQIYWKIQESQHQSPCCPLSLALPLFLIPTMVLLQLRLGLISASPLWLSLLGAVASQVMKLSKEALHVLPELHIMAPGLSASRDCMHPLTSWGPSATLTTFSPERVRRPPVCLVSAFWAQIYFLNGVPFSDKK